ncbi:MAG: carbohydrate kinase family protein [Bacteroidota bacterium]
MSNSQTLDAVVAGLALVDLIGRPVRLDKLPKRGGLQLLDSITLTTGGNVCNSAIDLRKLGFRVGAIARVGRDPLGEYIVSRLQAEGVETRGVLFDSTDQTSATFVSVGPDGERTFLHTRGCLKNFRARDVLKSLSMVKRSRIFAFGYYGLLQECEREMGRLFRTIREKTDAKVLLDTGGNPGRNPRILRSFLRHLDYFIPSYDEAMAITGARSPEGITKALQNAGARGVLGVKLGSDGCYILWNGSGRYIRPFRVRKVVDATGAGDAFVAGFLAGTLRGKDPFAAAEIGNAVAASCITAVGASTAVRSLASYREKRRTGSVAKKGTPQKEQK